MWNVDVDFRIRPRLRPTFNLRGRRPLGGASTTAAPSENEGAENAAAEQTSAEVSSTTPRAVSGYLNFFLE